jgi:hypothetical protein
MELEEKFDLLRELALGLEHCPGPVRSQEESQLEWQKTTAPVTLAGEQWTHMAFVEGQVLLARLRPSGVTEKVCRLLDES